MYYNLPTKEKKLVNIVAKEILIYEEGCSPSKNKKTWEDLDEWKKIHYRCEAQKMIAIIRSATRRKRKEVRK